MKLSENQAIDAKKDLSQPESPPKHLYDRITDGVRQRLRPFASRRQANEQEAVTALYKALLGRKPTPKELAKLKNSSTTCRRILTGDEFAGIVKRFNQQQTIPHYEQLGPAADSKLSALLDQWALNPLGPLCRERDWQRILACLLDASVSRIPSLLPAKDQNALTKSTDALISQTRNSFPMRHPGYFQTPGEEQIDRLFQLFFGRRMNQNDSLILRQQQGYLGVIERFLNSDEFGRVTQNLLEHKQVPQQRQTEDVPDWAAGFLCSILDLTQATQRSLTAARSWPNLLLSLLTDENFTAQFLVSEQDSAGNARTKAGRFSYITAQLSHDVPAYVTKAEFLDGNLSVVVYLSEGVSADSLTLSWSDAGIICTELRWTKTHGSHLHRFEGSFDVADNERIIASNFDATLKWKGSNNTISLPTYPIDIIASDAEVEQCVQASGRKITEGHSESAVVVVDNIAARDELNPRLNQAHAEALVNIGDLSGALKVATSRPFEDSLFLAGMTHWSQEKVPEPLPSEPDDPHERRALELLLGNETDANAILADQFEDILDDREAANIETIEKDDFASLLIACAMSHISHTTLARLMQQWLIDDRKVDAIYERVTRPFVRAELNKAMQHIGTNHTHGNSLRKRLARYYYNRSDYETSKLFFEKYQQHGKLDRETYIFASYLYSRLGTLDGRKKAVEYLREARKKGATDQRMLERSITLEKDVALKDPLWNRLALRNDIDTLTSQACIALSRQPDSPQLRHRLAIALIFNDEYDDAHEILQSVVAEYPENFLIRRDLIRTFVQLGKNEEIVEHSRHYLTEEFDNWVLLQLVRALRALDLTDEGQLEIQKHMAHCREELRVEFARGYFIKGDFESALEYAEKLREEFPDNSMLHVLTTAALIELDRFDDAAAKLVQIPDVLAADHLSLEVPLFKYSVAKANQSASIAIKELDTLFLSMGCEPLRVRLSNSDKVFDALVGSEKPTLEEDVEFLPLVDGPLVSVVMTAFDAEDYIATAVRSILDQNYANIELIVVDDKSTDKTLEVLEALSLTDSRLNVISKTTNDGTYVSKNIGILNARGTYIALQDSDDWSHPDRIGKSVAVLEQRKDIIGLTTDWVRMTTEGDFVIKSGAQISHLCCISFVFRREEVISQVGLFDSVRIEADMEYIKRIGIVFGTDRVARLRWPLLLGRAHDASLTANSEYGITRTGFTTPRLDYQKAYKIWHQQIADGESGFLPFPLSERIYSAPQMMLPERTVTN